MHISVNRNDNIMNDADGGGDWGANSSGQSGTPCQPGWDPAHGSGTPA